jgi:ABC-type phosphate transport system substrate-binding protein
MQTRLLGRIGRFGALVAVCTGVALTTGASAASAAEVSCANITASGSSLQNLAQKSLWIPEWEATGWNTLLLELVCKEKPKITYEPTSSGKGLAEWGSVNGKLTPAESFNKEKLDAFVGTDVGPEGGPAGLEEGMVEAGTQIANMDEAGKNAAKPAELNKVVTIPVAQSAIAVLVTLPEGCSVTGTGSVVNMALWEVYDKANEFKKVNFLELTKGLTFTGTSCNNSVLPLARSTNSGTTAGFKRYLDDLEPAVYGTVTSNAVKSESFEEWPNKPPLPDEAGNGTGGELTKKVFETVGANGAIGYADLADARKNGFTAAPGTPQKHTVGTKEVTSIILLVPNDGATLGSEGTEDVSPEASGGGAHCSKAKYTEPKKVGPNIDWSRAKESNATSSEEGTYPLCTLTFDVAWLFYSYPEWENLVTKGKEKYTEAEFHTVSSYLHWIVAVGNGLAGLKTDHFWPIPNLLLKEDEEGANMETIYWTGPGK